MHECLVYFYDAKDRTGVDVCMKFADGHAVSATVTRPDDQPRYVPKVDGRWRLPELWEDRSTIAWLLTAIEKKESKYASTYHQGR